jgi:hypothetical protein
MTSTKSSFLLGALCAAAAMLATTMLVGQTPSKPAAEEKAGLDVSATDVPASYANFCRVTGTPEEVILDFGLNTQPIGVPQSPIKISNRIVMNYFTAKRMIGALAISIQRHEAAFGPIETDVQKRVKRPDSK